MYTALVIRACEDLHEGQPDNRNLRRDLLVY